MIRERRKNERERSGRVIFTLDDVGIRAEAENGPEFVRQQLVEFIGHIVIVDQTKHKEGGWLVRTIRKARWPLHPSLEQQALRFLNEHSTNVRWSFSAGGSLVCREVSTV